MHRLWLVARREIVAYAGVPSFWVALLTGPLLMLIAAVGAGQMGRPPAPPPPRVVAIEAPKATGAWQRLLCSVSGAPRAPSRPESKH